MEVPAEQSRLALLLLARQLFPGRGGSPPGPQPEDEDTRRLQEKALQNLIGRLFSPNPDSIPLLHPSFKALGRLWVPLQFVKPTTGLERFLGEQPYAPSLCQPGREGTCRLGAACGQIHLDDTYRELVERALAVQPINTCCKLHGDPASACSDLFSLSQLQNVELRVEGHPPFRITPHRIAITYFWYKLLKQKRRTVWFPADRICALHQQSGCRYGVECKHVHLCRQLWAEIALQVDYKDLAQTVAEEPPTPHDTVDQGKGVARPSRALPIFDPLSGEEVTVAKPLERCPSDAPAAPAPVPNPNSVEFKTFSFTASAQDPRGSARGSAGSPPPSSLDDAPPAPEKEACAVDLQPRHKPLTCDTANATSSALLGATEGDTDGGRKVEASRPSAREREAGKASPRASPPPDPEWVRKMEATRGKFKRVKDHLLLGVEVVPGPGDGRPAFQAGRGRRLGAGASLGVD